MKIKNYEPDALRNAQEALNENEERLMSSNDRKGSKENPYSLMEMYDLIKDGRWSGGFVDFLGSIRYIDKDDFKYGEGGSDWYEIQPSESIPLSNVSIVEPSNAVTSPSSSSEKLQIHSVEVTIEKVDYIIEEIVKDNFCAVIIKTGSKCYESQIPAITVYVTYKQKTATYKLHLYKMAPNIIEKGTVLGSFGFFKLKGQEVVVETSFPGGETGSLPVAEF